MHTNSNRHRTTNRTTTRTGNTRSTKVVVEQGWHGRTKTWSTSSTMAGSIRSISMTGSMNGSMSGSTTPSIMGSQTATTVSPPLPPTSQAAAVVQSGIVGQDQHGKIQIHAATLAEEEEEEDLSQVYSNQTGAAAGGCRRWRK
jgi:hypothetical protein